MSHSALKEKAVGSYRSYKALFAELIVLDSCFEVKVSRTAWLLSVCKANERRAAVERAFSRCKVMG